MRDVIISDYACTNKICVDLLNALWPNDPPLVLSIPATGASEAHRKWVDDFRQAHGGAFLEPFIGQKLALSEVRSVSLIGFSAGCWGVREILSDPKDAARVTFVYACDGLHGKYTSGKSVAIQDPWLAFASRAVSGDTLMVVSYSAIQPPGYPSTRESAGELGRQYGAAWGSPPSVGGFVRCLPSCSDPSAVGAQEFGQRGNLILLGSWPEGSTGDNAAAHVYQANVVQPAVWRTYLAPWLQGTPAPGVEPAGKKKWSTLGVLAIITAGVLGTWWVAKRSG